jgi:hypothetical protein
MDKPDITPDGRSIISYRWTGPFGEVEGAKTTVSLPAGVYECVLTVSDGWIESSDSVLITIKEIGEDEEKEALGYTLFTGSNNSPMAINSAIASITGDVHSNNEFVFNGLVLNAESDL